MSRLAGLAEDVGDPVALRMRTELWLIRHGESEGNDAGRLQGQAESPLTPRGVRQAQAVAERLRGMTFAALYSSDLERARNTAAAISATVGLPVVIDPRLREIDIGSWSGLTPEAIAAHDPAGWEAWMRSRSGHQRRGGGESYADLVARVRPVCDELAERHAGQRLLVVAHGGTINAYLSSILHLSVDQVWRLSQENTAVSRVQPFANPNRDARIPPGRVLTMNDISHLHGVS